MNRLRHIPLLSLLRPTISLVSLQARRGFSSTRSSWALREFMLADIGEGITEVEVVKWLVEEGQTVEEFDPIVEVMSDKATVEITSPYTGKVASLAGAVGDRVRVGKKLCVIDEEGDDPTPTPQAEVEVKAATPPSPSQSASPAPPPPPPQPTSSPLRKPQARPSPSSSSSSEVYATPATRRVAREASVDLNSVVGTGKNGRITNEDVLKASKSAKDSTSAIFDDQTTLSASPIPAEPTARSRPSPSATLSSTSGETTTIPLSPVRKAMFRAMTATLAVPHFNYSDTIDVTLLERLRLKLNAHVPLRYRTTLSAAEEKQLSGLEKWGSDSATRVQEGARYDRLTQLPLLVKALSLAMDEHPLFSCTLNNKSDSDPTLVRRPSHDISLAVSSPTGEGLFTPLLPSVNTSSPYSLASSIALLQSTAPRFPSQHSGTGTITLSNVGVVGGRTTSPIIPPTGQLAIGAMGRMRVEPRFVGEEEGRAVRVAKGVEKGAFGGEWKVEPRLVLDVTFAADHRVVEGVELAKLVETWKRIVEDPERIVGGAR